MSSLWIYLESLTEQQSIVQIDLAQIKVKVVSFHWNENWKHIIPEFFKHRAAEMEPREIARGGLLTTFVSNTEIPGNKFSTVIYINRI